MEKITKWQYGFPNPRTPNPAYNYSEAHSRYFRTLARLESIRHLDPSESATALAGEMKILIPIKGLVDQVAEGARLDKELQKKQKELDQCEQQLANPNFAERAPEAVVAKKRSRISELASAISKLREHYKEIVFSVYRPT